MDGALEQRPILATGADAIDELLHYAFVFAAQRGGERAEIDILGGEIEFTLTGGGAGKRNVQAAGEVCGAESSGDAIPTQVSG